MTVAVDATPLVLSSGGLRRYTVELVNALATEFPDDTYRLVTDQPVSCPPVQNNIELAARRPGTWIERRWWLFGIHRAARNATVFHGVNFAVPYWPAKPSVLTVHDLSPWRERSWHSGAGRVRKRTPILLRLGIATMVITPSQAVRSETIERFGCDPNRVASIPEAASDQFRPVEPWSTDRYILFVGTIEPRKNLPMLVEAWRELRKSHSVRLVIAGRIRSDGVSPAAESGLTMLGEVPDTLLPRLYSGAACTVYPSAYEGFGLPVLEAMQCGSPVITTSNAALLEVTGPAGLRADTTGDLLTAMRALLDNSDLRSRQREAGLARARDFSWAHAAHLTRAVYEEAVRRFRD